MDSAMLVGARPLRRVETVNFTRRRGLLHQSGALGYLIAHRFGEAFQIYAL